MDPESLRGAGAKSKLVWWKRPDSPFHALHGAFPPWTRAAQCGLFFRKRQFLASIAQGIRRGASTFGRFISKDHCSPTARAAWLSIADTSRSGGSAGSSRSRLSRRAAAARCLVRSGWRNAQSRLDVFWFALVVAGIFTLLSGRVMHQIVFG